MCFKCLTTGHVARDCNTRVECSKCKREHLDVLHPEGPFIPPLSSNGPGTTYYGNRNPFAPSRGNGNRNGGGYGYNNRGTYRGNSNTNNYPANSNSNTNNTPANSNSNSNTNNAPANSNSNPATTSNNIGNPPEANITTA